MEKMSIQTLNSVFYYLDKDSDTVLWIRSPDYKKQIYVSPGFEKLWKRSCDILYTNPECWGTFLVNNEYYNRAVSLLKARRPQREKISTDTVLYQIYLPNHSISYMRDKSFFITDEQDTIVAVAGITESLKQQQWEKAYQEPSKEPMIKLRKIENEVSVLLNKEYRHTMKNIVSFPNNNKRVIRCKDINVVFTPREAECIFYLLQGKSAKQTAALMNVSPRTVEIFISNAKNKANCRTKLELLSKIIPHDEFVPEQKIADT